MQSTASDIIDLYYRRSAGTLTDQESQKLSDWLRENPLHATQLEELFADESFSESFMHFSPDRLRQLDQELFSAIRSQLPFGQEKYPASVHRVHFLRTAWFRWAAAIIILFGIGTYIFSLTSTTDKEVSLDQPSIKSVDIMPGSDKAVLTLSNGERIQLNSAASETIKEGALSIQNSNGQLSYQHSDIVAINTMSTPKGGQYKLTLADGTKVWLNAASSITYPTAFKGDTREVSISGEAYFEVRSNKSHPFIVKTSTDQITVLGTFFNINAYQDEASVKTSLIDGAIKIGNTKVKPGEAYQNGIVNRTDLSRDIAWKNGYFNFEGADFGSVMRQLARWYDITVDYEGEIQEVKFEGRLSRDLTLSQIVEVLKEMDVRFTIEGRRLLVRKIE